MNHNMPFRKTQTSREFPAADMGEVEGVCGGHTEEYVDSLESGGAVSGCGEHVLPQNVRPAVRPAEGSL